MNSFNPFELVISILVRFAYNGVAALTQIKREAHPAREHCALDLLVATIADNRGWRFDFVRPRKVGPIEKSDRLSRLSVLPAFAGTRELIFVIRSPSLQTRDYTIFAYTYTWVRN